MWPLRMGFPDQLAPPVTATLAPPYLDGSYLACSTRWVVETRNDRWRCRIRKTSEMPRSYRYQTADVSCPISCAFQMRLVQQKIKERKKSKENNRDDACSLAVPPFMTVVQRCRFLIAIPGAPTSRQRKVKTVQRLSPNHIPPCSVIRVQAPPRYRFLSRSIRDAL